MMEYGSESAKLNGKIANDAQAEALKKQCQERRDRALVINLILHDEAEELVRDRLAKSYHPETFDHMQVRVSKEINVMTDILDEYCVAWDAGASYWYLKKDKGEGEAVEGEGETGNESEDDEEDPGFARIKQTYDFDSLMKNIDYLCVPHGAIAAMPVNPLDEERGVRCPSIRVLTPQHFDMIPQAKDNTKMAVFVVYEDRNTAGEEFKTEWSASEWVRFRFDDSKNEWTRVDGAEHSYGRIPVVIFKADKNRLWPATKARRMADVTLEAAVADTQSRYQMGGQVKVAGGNGAKFQSGQYLRHGGALDVPEGTTVVDFQTHIEAFDKTFIENRIARMRRAFKLPANAQDAGPNASGEARKMSMFERDKAAIARRVWLRDSLRDLFWLILDVFYWDMQVPGAAPIDGFKSTKDLPDFKPNTPYSEQDYVFGSDVREITYPELASERQQKEQDDIAGGYRNRADIMLEKNPDLRTQEAAKQALLANIEFEAEFQAAKAKVRAITNPLPTPGAPPNGEPPQPEDEEELEEGEAA